MSCFRKSIGLGTSISLIGSNIWVNSTQFSHHYQPIFSAVGFAILGYYVVDYLVPRLRDSFLKIGLKGKDMSKTNEPVIPECLGSVAAVVYLFLMFFFIPFIFFSTYIAVTSGGGNRDFEVSGSGVVPEINTKLGQGIGFDNKFPHNKLSEYLSAVLCLESQVLLGIADDLFDVKWRHKFFMPAIASIPLLIVYYVDFGVTSILVPYFLVDYLKKTTIDLGILYYAYMACVAIFCPNSINILAGINGLEVGQSIVMAMIFVINDSYYIFFSGNPASISCHMFSVCLLVPFMGVSLALLKYNWFPAKVFVGDTYCYFAGMVFAVVGILGHFSKTLLLFFMPQVFNFLYSVPQLFHLLPIPRHRLPKFDTNTGLMNPSMAVLFEEEQDEQEEQKQSEPTKTEQPNKIEKPQRLLLNPRGNFVQIILGILAALYLIKVERTTVRNGKQKKQTMIRKFSNLTFINLVLVIFGPLREDYLCLLILLLQFIIGLMGITIRHAAEYLL